MAQAFDTLSPARPAHMLGLHGLQELQEAHGARQVALPEVPTHPQIQLAQGKQTLRSALRRKGLSPGASGRILLGNESVLPETIEAQGNMIHGDVVNSRG